MAFAHKFESNAKNKYHDIIRKSLEKEYIDYDDIYDYGEDSIEIGVLDEWLDKAKEHLNNKNYKEAIAIAQTCLEEYAEWLEDIESGIAEFIDVSYQETPFEIIEEAALSDDINKNDLYQYCKAESVKSKYSGYFADGFQQLLGKLAGTDNATDFIQIQDELLNKVFDKSSYEAEKILNRKIDLYTKNSQPEQAWEIITQNIQIENFRKKVVRQKIQENDLAEAKKLIHDYLNQQKNNYAYLGDWQEMILEIAQKKKDIPTIRKTSFRFIESYFNANYYRVYKATFKPEDWNEELEKIITHYAKGVNYFHDNVADVLVEEGAKERLMRHVEKHLSAHRLEKYYVHFHNSFPETTLNLFRKSTDNYAKENTGREHYEYIVQLLRIMKRINNGNKMVKEMVSHYRILYKNRRAMMEILSKV